MTKVMNKLTQRTLKRQASQISGTLSVTSSTAFTPTVPYRIPSHCCGFICLEGWVSWSIKMPTGFQRRQLVRKPPIPVLSGTRHQVPMCAEAALWNIPISCLPGALRVSITLPQTLYLGLWSPSTYPFTIFPFYKLRKMKAYRLGPWVTHKSYPRNLD